MGWYDQVYGKLYWCQNSQTNQSLTSVLQSWCTALGAIGDVFGHLTQVLGKELQVLQGLLSPAIQQSLAYDFATSPGLQICGVVYEEVMDEDPELGDDDVLLKKVRAALAKCLK